MNNITNIYNQNKKSGWLKVFIGLGLLIMAIPIMIYGLLQALYNGASWMGRHPQRKESRLIRKETKLETKENIKRLKEKRKGEKDEQ